MQILDQRFWARFAKTTWEKKSITVRDIQAPLLEINEQEVFKLVVDYSDRCRRLKSVEGMKFYIEGHRQFASEVMRHLPKKSDGSFAGYHERMESQYADYCLVCDELLQVNVERQEALNEFTSLLFSKVGLPNRFAEMGLYLGNYRKTPFGVHEDACGVFSFPVVGKKKFRIWKPRFVKQNPKLARAFSYGKYKAGSQVLEAKVGDMTYWPSSAWHIAESDGSFSVTWSLGVWVDKPHAEVVTEVIAPLQRKLLGSLGTAATTAIDAISSKSGEIKSLPETYLETLSLLKSQSSKKLESAFREAWISHLSKRGFKNTPAFDVKLGAASMVRLRNPERPIHWMKDGASTLYSFNGATTRSSSKTLFKFLMLLNQGRLLRAPKGVSQLAPLAVAGAFEKI